MKKKFNRLKRYLATLWAAIISFPLKVMGQTDGRANPDPQPMYGIYNPGQTLYGVPAPESPTIITIRIVQILLIVVVFIIGIVNFIKIRKIDDKAQKKKKIKITILIILAIVILILLISLLARLLIRKDAYNFAY